MEGKFLFPMYQIAKPGSSLLTMTAGMRPKNHEYIISLKKTFHK